VTSWPARLASCANVLGTVVEAVVVEPASRRSDDVHTGGAHDLEHLAGHITNPLAIVPIGRLPQ
jgi:hypothetical protein